MSESGELHLVFSRRAAAQQGGWGALQQSGLSTARHLTQATVPHSAPHSGCGSEPQQASTEVPTISWFSPLPLKLTAGTQKTGFTLKTSHDSTWRHGGLQKLLGAL